MLPLELLDQLQEAVASWLRIPSQSAQFLSKTFLSLAFHAHSFYRGALERETSDCSSPASKFDTVQSVDVPCLG